MYNKPFPAQYAKKAEESVNYAVRRKHISSILSIKAENTSKRQQEKLALHEPVFKTSSRRATLQIKFWAHVDSSKLSARNKKAANNESVIEPFQSTMHVPLQWLFLQESWSSEWCLEGDISHCCCRYRSKIASAIAASHGSLFHFAEVITISWII